MKERMWLAVLVAVVALVVTVGCGKESAPAADPASPPSRPAAEVTAPAAPAPEVATEVEPVKKEVLFSEDFESGEVGRWSNVTIVEGGAGGSKYAGQGTVGKNPEYWGLELPVDENLKLSLDIYSETPITELQIISHAKTANGNFRLQQSSLSPGRWHHIEARVADFFAWEGGSLVGDTIDNVNIWVQGMPESTFKFDNVTLFK